MSSAKRVKEICTPKKSVFEHGTRDTVDSLADLARGKIDTTSFFADNHFTQGMRDLCEYGLKRLNGKFDTGVFRLKQAMGGGKTHSLIAFGLLASNSLTRGTILSTVGIDPCTSFGSARIICFEGRERPVHGLWGYIAKELGNEPGFNRFYSPLTAPGKSDWAAMIGQAPTVIMLDELPPYLESAAATSIGSTDLATVTADALANLLMAVQEMLPQCVVIITDLNSAWEGGSLTLDGAIKSANILSSEVSRSAMNIEPVRLNSNEIYDILRKRLFESTGSAQDRIDIELEFRQAYEKAEKSGFAASSAFGFVSEIVDSYPFHPKFKELCARFKENEGFQQTRGILRMARAIVGAIYESSCKIDPWLIGPASADLNNPSVFGEFKRANPAIETAVSSDIANGGSSVAEKASALAEEAAKTILMASLARGSSQARLGLSENEISSILIEPNRSNTEIRAAIEKIRSESLYLHMSGSGDLFYRENKNLTAAIRDEIQRIRAEDAERLIKQKLEEIFKVKSDSIHQDLLVFPDRTEIVNKTTWERILLAIVRADEWTGGIHALPESLREVFESGLSGSCKNRLMLLSLGKEEWATSIKNSRELLALRSVIKARVIQGISESDPEFVEAKKREVEISAKLTQSILSSPSHLHFPDGSITTRAVEKSNFIKKATDGSANGAELLRETLEKAEKALPVGWVTGDEFNGARRRFESKIFTMPESQRLALEKSAADNQHWLWCRAGEMDKFFARCIQMDLWREQGSNLLKQPKEGWPKPTPTVLLIDETVSQGEQREGKASLKVEVIHGDQIKWQPEGIVNESSPNWTGSAGISATWASFAAFDSKTGKRGITQTWINPQTSIRWDLRQELGSCVLTLESFPKSLNINSTFDIFYTVDGSSVRNQSVRRAYHGPVELPADCQIVQAIGLFERQEVNESNVISKIMTETSICEFKIDDTSSSQANERKPDPSKPIRYIGEQSVHGQGNVFQLINLLKEKNAKPKSGTIFFKSTGGDGSIQFGTRQNVSPESIQMLSDLLLSAFTVEIQKIKFSSIEFEKESDLNDFSKAMNIDVVGSDWEQD